MNNVAVFSSFIPSYKKLQQLSHNKDLNIFIQYFHHDDQSEPFLFLEGKVDSLRLDEVEEHGKIISITTPESMFTFTERNYLTNISGDAVVFSSKNDNETYCIIEFI